MEADLEKIEIKKISPIIGNPVFLFTLVTKNMDFSVFFNEQELINLISQLQESLHQ